MELHFVDGAVVGMRLSGGVEVRNTLSTEVFEANVVVGRARHGLNLEDLAADHGPVADSQRIPRLNAYTRRGRIVIAQNSVGLPDAAHSAALDRITFGIEHFNLGVEQRAETG